MEDCERDVICEERGYNEKESSEENDFWAQKTEWYANRHVRWPSTQRGAFNFSTMQPDLCFVFTCHTGNRNRGLVLLRKLNCCVRYAGATSRI
jgi:hypothetical protein